MAKQFVATTDEVWRLQQGDDPEAIFFQNVAQDGHYRGAKSKSQQGIYIISPGGKLLGSLNSTSPEYVLRIMQQGLENWEKLPAEQRRLQEDSLVKPKHRWEDSYQPEGLDLVIFTRDLPRQCDPSQPVQVKWNQDRAWFSKSEARQWLPDEIKTGEKHNVPEEIVQRLVRVHLLDTVKGQSSEFYAEDISRAEIEVTVSAVDGQRASIRFSGTTRAESRKEWEKQKTYPHGVATSLMGEAVFDTSEQRFVEFEMVALGKRWGRTAYNDRHRDGPSNPIGFVFQLAPPETPVIAPGFLNSYEADWVKRPQ